MRLVLPFPDDWKVGLDSAGWVRAGEPDLVIAVSPVRPLPALVDAGFFGAELGAGLDAPGRLQLDDSGEQRGSRGWPVTLIRGAVIDDGGEVLEQRLAAIYRLLDRFATALVIGRDPARWNAEVAALGDIVLAGDLDWAGPPASLSELLGPMRER